MSDSDWPSVQAAYSQMTGRYRLGLAGACAALVLALFAYTALLLMLYRREFALRRMLGTPMRKARRSFTAPFLLTALPAYALAVLVCYVRSASTLPQRLAEIAPGQAPGRGNILALLALTAVGCLLVSYVILRLLILPERKKSLQKLLA